jgi:hypothetical protein
VAPEIQYAILVHLVNTMTLLEMTNVGVVTQAHILILVHWNAQIAQVENIKNHLNHRHVIIVLLVNIH